MDHNIPISKEANQLRITWSIESNATRGYAVIKQEMLLLNKKVFVFYKDNRQKIQTNNKLKYITCHTPIFAVGSENGRLKMLHIFKASEYNSVMLFNTAKTAAKG